MLDVRLRSGLTATAVVLCLLACVTVAVAQTDTVWVRRLCGTGNGDDEVRALASGPDGSIYALVQNKPSDSAVAIITAKYSSSGQLLWSQRFEGDGYVIPADIAVDASGDVFVTGSARRPDRWYDMVTLKYTASGDSAWVRYYDAEGNNDEASTVVVDGEGSAYVVGYGESNDRYEDMALVKYSSTGEELWAQLYDFQENEDFGLAAAIDSQGYVYEVGLVCNWQGAGDYDMQVLKYSPQGALVWARTFAGPDDSDDSAVAVTVDPQNNLLVVGCTHPNVDSSGYLLVKYNSAGDTLWSRSFIDEDDCNNAVAVGTDAQSNVVLAGNNNDAYLAVKYSPTGTELWRRSYHGPRHQDSLAGMQVDPSGNVYVTGWSEGEHWETEAATVKYSATGESLWARRWMPDDSLESVGLALALADSEVIMGGFYNNHSLDNNALLIRYESDGNEQWIQSLNGPGTDGAGEGKDVTFDADGNVIVAGWLENFNHYKDLAVAKYSASGELLWVQSYGNIAGEEDVAVAVQADSWGNVYVTGYSEGDGTGLDYVTLKCDPWGNRLWANRYNGPADNDDKPVALAVDRSGNVVVTGQSYGVGTDLDYATVKYTSGGRELWVRRHNGSADSADYAGAIAVDNTGVTYVSGRNHEVGERYPAATIKYGILGDILWTAYCEDPHPSLTSFGVKGMTIDSAGFVLLGGYGSCAFLAAKLSPSGDTVWTARADLERSCRAYSAIGDEGGRVYVTGLVRGDHYPDFDYVTVAFNAYGEEFWRQTYDGGDNDRDEAYDVAVSTDGKVFVTGRSEGYMTSYDAVTIGYDTLGRQVWVDSFNGREGSSWRDLGNAVSCGTSGCVAVAGYSGESYSDRDFLTIVYAPRIGLAEPRGATRLVESLSMDAHPNPFTGSIRFRILTSRKGKEQGLFVDSCG